MTDGSSLGMPDIRVLIVDDDVPTRVGVRAILSSEPDIEVVGEAPTAREGIELVSRLVPDVVLMDVRLPDMDGLSATRQIIDVGYGEDDSALKADRAPPRVIVLTTFDLDDYVYRSIRAGASGFLLKRTPAEDIVAAVRTVAGGAALPMPAKTRHLLHQYARSDDTAARVELPTTLTAREREVLVLIARGLSNQEIAEQLYLSVETVKTHVKRVYMKCGARDRAQAVIAAYESGLVQ
jgi:DNA-binding NarL/FixJ family response regulator